MKLTPIAELLLDLAAIVAAHKPVRTYSAVCLDPRTGEIVRWVP